MVGLERNWKLKREIMVIGLLGRGDLERNERF